MGPGPAGAPEMRGPWRTILWDRNAGVHVEWRTAPPLRLHAPPLHRADCNTPVLTEGDRTLAMPAHFVPIGHSHRRVGHPPFRFAAPGEPVRIVDDPDPGAGKWIESLWRSPDGALYGWYHCEAPAPCPRTIAAYRIGALVSRDDGASWHDLGPVLAPQPDELDCTFDNGWFAGGFGDFTVIPDRAGTFFLIHLTSYHALDAAQGIVVARYPIRDRDAPAAALEWWTADGWQPRHRSLPQPIIRPARGWRHADPDAHWGPAVHENSDTGGFVMLLNRTYDGDRTLTQRAVEVSFNRDAGDPGGWTRPRVLVRGAIWYPEAIAPLGSDRRGGGTMRFFVSGFSAWEIRFHRGPPPAGPEPEPAAFDEADLARLFGPRQPDGGFGT
ncbi:hypothetical protein STVA_10670 [Allostella vacuolata]|nr:hypothetical protein STVA_10670 [Stella vacuolata]